MDMIEVRRKRLELEARIFTLCKAFENETSCEIDYVDITRVSRIGNQEESSLKNIKLEVLLRR
jgi:hypothetical protein